MLCKKRRLSAAGSDQSVRVSPARSSMTARLCLAVNIFFHKVYQHSFQTFLHFVHMLLIHFVPLSTKAERGAAVGEADVRSLGGR